MPRKRFQQSFSVSSKRELIIVSDPSKDLEYVDMIHRTADRRTLEPDRESTAVYRAAERELQELFSDKKAINPDTPGESFRPRSKVLATFLIFIHVC